VSDDDIVDIFTDGACSGNPGPGGWGRAVCAKGTVEKEIFGGEAATTNNRMEMMAAIQALEALTRPTTARLHTDSSYLRDGITKWIHGWKRKRLEDRRQEAGEERGSVAPGLETAMAPHRIEWLWVKGHSGHPENERVDALAPRRGQAPARIGEAVGSLIAVIPSAARDLGFAKDPSLRSG